MTSFSPPTARRAWWLAARPRTWPAAISPVITGTAVALHEGQFGLWPAAAALVAALLLQIGANLTNDLFDYRRGADSRERLGPPRATQMGWLTPRQMLFGMMAVFGTAALVGLYLVQVGGWPILAVGVLSILFAITYTAGPFPLAYVGLGDLSAFLFFGLVAVCGTYYLQAGYVSPLAVGAAIPIGFLVTAILVVNNVRDLPQDRKVGKHTMAVLLGERGARAEYVILLTGAYVAPLLMILGGQGVPLLLLTWLSLPLAYRQVKLVLRERGRALNPALGGTGQVELMFALLFALGLVLS